MVRSKIVNIVEEKFGLSRSRISGQCGHFDPLRDIEGVYGHRVIHHQSVHPHHLLTAEKVEISHLL